MSEKIVRPKGRGCEMQEGGSLPQSRQYALCRCDKSCNEPFCDASHVTKGYRDR